MGLLDDTASLISGRTSHSKHHHHRSSHQSSSSTKHRHHRSARDDSRSRSRSRTRGIGGGSGSVVGIATSIFGGGVEAVTGGGGHRENRESREHHRHSTSSARSIFGGDANGHKHNASRSSFFGLGSGGNGSRSSFFGFGRAPSYYKRSPRPNFMQRILRRLKRLLRDLVYYAKRHPIRVFMLVIAPLITGGALTALLARFGLRLPSSIERMLGLAARVGSGGGAGDLVGEAVRMASGAAAAGGYGQSRATVERGRDGGMQWERRSVQGDRYGGGGSSGGGGGWGDGLMGVAKMFM